MLNKPFNGKVSGRLNGILHGPQEIPILWSHIQNRIWMSYQIFKNISQNDIANTCGLDISCADFAALHRPCMGCRIAVGFGRSEDLGM